MEYRILQYPVHGDGIHTDTEALQQVIDLCARQGGGRVVLESGHVYLCGTVELKSQVELHLESGAVLKASGNEQDYRPLDASEDGTILGVKDGMPVTALLFAKDAENVRVTGFGMIDGNMAAFSHEESRYILRGYAYPRPPLVFFENCTHVTVQDVTLQNAAFWTLHPVGCTDLMVSGIRILNDLRMANSDGIDPDHCRDVRIMGCHIVCGDDGIVLKNTRRYAHYGPTRGVVITGCTLISTSAAIKIGTEGVDDFSDILVDNCSIQSSNRGVSMQIRDSGRVKNVSFSNITIRTRRFSPAWWGTAEPIYITSVNRDQDVVSGSIEQVRFSNIFCEGENGVLLYADQKGKIRNIFLDGLTLCLKQESVWPHRGYDLRPCQAQEWLDMPPAGLRAMGCEQLHLGSMSLETGDFPQCALEDAAPDTP